MKLPLRKNDFKIRKTLFNTTMILLVVIHPEQDKMAPNSRRPCVRFQLKQGFHMTQETKEPAGLKLDFGH